MRVDKILIAIPAYNEEATILKTIDNCRQSFPSADVLVVNDCSTDSTLEILAKSEINYLSLPINLGVGGAMRAAFKFAHRNNYDYLVQVDADGQHNPADIQVLLSQSDRFDLVIGSRFMNTESYKVQSVRKAAIIVIGGYLRIITRTRLSDPTSGFRLSNRKAIMLFSQAYPTEYLADTVGSIVLADMAGLRFGECPTKMNRRQGGKPSQNHLKSLMHLSRTLIAISMMKLGNPYDMKGKV